MFIIFINLCSCLLWIIMCIEVMRVIAAVFLGQRVFRCASTRVRGPLAASHVMEATRAECVMEAAETLLVGGSMLPPCDQWLGKSGQSLGVWVWARENIVAHKISSVIQTFGFSDKPCCPQKSVQLQLKKKTQHCKVRKMLYLCFLMNYLQVHIFPFKPISVGSLILASAMNLSEI